MYSDLKTESTLRLIYFEKQKQFLFIKYLMVIISLTLKKNVFPVHCGWQFEVGTNKTASKLPWTPIYRPWYGSQSVNE